MKFQFDPTQPSTVRGAIWVSAAVIGLVFTWFGKDPSQVLLLAGGLAGGLGVAVKD